MLHKTLSSTVAKPLNTRLYSRFVIGSLTALCSYGFVWQYTKYQSSSKRWAKIYESLNKFQAIPLEGRNAKLYPWFFNRNLDEWEYKLVKMKGYFKDERFFVRRTRDGRLGYLVFAPFVTAVEKTDFIKRETNANNDLEITILVDLGWVPVENKKDIEMGNEPIPPLPVPEDLLFNDPDLFTGLKYMEENSSEDFNPPVTEIVGLVRRGEEQDIMNKKRNWPHEAVYTYIDLDFMARFFRIHNLNSASQAYIERIVPTYSEEEESLYPVPASIDNFDKPYLTPRKHLDYSMFWGGSTVVGMLTLLKLMVR